MRWLAEPGLALLKSFEQCRLSAYRDSVGVPTIGWGHTAGVSMGMTCDQPQADRWLVGDVQAAVNSCDANAPQNLTQNQFDALVVFTFNVGIGAEAHSTLLAKLKAGDMAGAADEFLKWDHAGGVVVPGLTRRRKAERALFLTT
jgi:GH24 family phage-related lysozyme (muramidase)